MSVQRKNSIREKEFKQNHLPPIALFVSTVMLTVDETRSFLAHHTYYHMEVNSTQKSSIGVTKREPRFLSPIEFFVSDLLPYGTVYSEWDKSLLVNCEHYHMESIRSKNFNHRQKKIRIWVFYLQFKFLSWLDIHMVLHTMDDRKRLLVHCKHYLMEFIWKQKF